MNKGLLLVLIVPTSPFNSLIRLLIFGSSDSPVFVSPKPEPDLPPGYVGI